MIYGSILVFILMTLSSPELQFVKDLEYGAAALAVCLNLTKTVLYAVSLHFTRKALVDYVDLKNLFDKAYETSQGAGLATIGMGLVFLSISVLIWAATV
jgi:hypothetical protein